MENITQETISRRKKWVIGDQLNDITNYLQQPSSYYNIINYLGENTSQLDEIKRNQEEYLQLLNIINDNNYTAMISIKPTQLGLSLPQSPFFSFLQFLDPILSSCCQKGVRLGIDMEKPQFYSLTLKCFNYLLDKCQNDIGGSSFLRVAIQADVVSSPEDVNHIIRKGGSIRLCKGAYHNVDNHDIKRYQDPDKIKENYLRCAEIISHGTTTSSLATHDIELIKEIDGKIGLQHFDLEYLYGYPPSDSVINLYNSVYLPYGKNWLSYCQRRDEWFKNI